MLCVNPRITKPPSFFANTLEKLIKQRLWGHMKIAFRIGAFIKIKTFAQLVCSMAVLMLTHAEVSEAADACWVVRHSHGFGFLANVPAYYLPDFYPSLAAAKAAAIQDMENRYMGMTPWCVSSPLTSFGLALTCYTCEDENFGYSDLLAYGLNSMPPFGICYMGYVDSRDASRWGLSPESGLDISRCANYTIKLSTADGQQESALVLTSVEPGRSANLIARVYDQNNQLVPNVGVQLMLEAKQNSGGHHHGDDTVAARTGTIAGQQVRTGNTGPGGQGFFFTHNAPGVSGDIDILATCTGGKNCTPQGPKQVWVGIKGLAPLASSEIYVLLPNVNDPKHPDNHYMTYTAMLQVTVLAVLYHGQFPDGPLLHLNDASLERGGLLDYKAKDGAAWKPPHETHREGIHIDIRANPDINPDTAIPIKNFKDFVEIAKKTGGIARLHNVGTSTQHYHVRF